MNSIETKNKMNMLGKSAKPFLFIVDYAMENCRIVDPADAFEEGILFNFNGIRNYPEKWDTKNPIKLIKQPVPYHHYKKAFDKIVLNLKQGNSYLVNLTFPTPVDTDFSLKQIFHSVQAKYRLLNNQEFVVFSPESFVKIKDKKITTYPMKGTIDASLPNAEALLLSNQKEMAEHATIVDLLRNDLSKVATEVKVERYRYVEKITTSNKQLLQVSSKISGTLSDNYDQNIGNIIFDMLPAGSITGAPKKKTLEIIEDAESYQRGYYSGVAGYFDGKNLDSCVLIRYIENKDGQFIYKSGGGITNQSIPHDEYQELIDKIYVPSN
jgi:para-aminobenzoate synthetase component 1